MRIIRFCFKNCFCFVILIFTYSAIQAQDSSSLIAKSPINRSVKLKDALSLAVNYYPSLRIQSEKVKQSEANLALGRHQFIPQLTAAYQANIATYNNITGMNFPQTLIPISGPPSSGNDYNPVPGSAASVILNWNPITFGQRSAYVETLDNQLLEVMANQQNEMIVHQANVISAYLDIVNLTFLIDVSEKNIDRIETGLIQTLALSRNGLRAGIDSIQFQASLSQARIDMINLEQEYQQKIILLNRLVGISSDTLMVPADTLFGTSLPNATTILQDQKQHPLYQISLNRLAASRSAFKQMKRSIYPRLDFWATAYGRGSGINNNGEVNDDDGLRFTRYNYGVGFQLSFPFTQLWDYGQKKDLVSSQVNIQEFQLAETSLLLEQYQRDAIQVLNQKYKTVPEIALQLNAANIAFQTLQSQYNSGLTDFTRLIQAQYDLFRAEVNQRNTYVDSWKALLQKNIAQGNLDEFLQQVK